jgi:hypothetical protein
MPMTRVHDDSMLQLNGYERAVLSGMRGLPEGSPYRRRRFVSIELGPGEISGGRAKLQLSRKGGGSLFCGKEQVQAEAVR